MSKSAKIIAIVPVRAGSKGLPGKNVRLLDGEPLYLRAVKQALRLVDCCVISTDISEILHAPAPKRTQLLRRPPELATDQTVMAEVVADVIDRLNLRDEPYCCFRPHHLCAVMKTFVQFYVYMKRETMTLF